MFKEVISVICFASKNQMAEVQKRVAESRKWDLISENCVTLQARNILQLIPCSERWANYSLSLFLFSLTTTRHPQTETCRRLLVGTETQRLAFIAPLGHILTSSNDRKGMDSREGQ
jgi:hypothetical protein